MIWIRNAQGKQDAMLTAGVAALGVCLVRVLLAGVTIGSYTFPPAPDAGTIAALLGPTLGAYVARRNGILSANGEPKVSTKPEQKPEVMG